MAVLSRWSGYCTSIGVIEVALDAQIRSSCLTIA